MFRLLSIVVLLATTLVHISSQVYAVTYPATTPFGETPGGTFRTYFDNMYINYPTCSSAGEVIGGFTASGVPICVIPVSSGFFFTGQTNGDTIRFNGTDWVRTNFLYNNGVQVGIGTQVPQATLDISGNIRINHPSAASGRFLVSDVNGIGTWTDNIPATSFSISGSVLGSTTYYNGSSWLATTNLFNTGGYIGIGTVSPQAVLDVNGQIRMNHPSAASGRFLVSDANGIASWTDNVVATSFSISGQTLGATTYYNGTNWVAATNLFNTGGNIGIGTVTPAYRLDVGGSDILVHGIRVGRGQGSILSNSVFGYNVAGGNVTGMNNSIFGSYGLASNVSGSNNTAIGVNAGSNLVSGDNNIFIGYNTQPNMGNTSSNQLNIGNWIYGNAGNIGIGVLSPTARLEVNGQVRITGGGAGSGRYLVSDATGLASWTDMVAATTFSLSGQVTGATPYYNGTNWLASTNIFNTGGNIGIGTSTPQYKLDVLGGNGVIRAGSGFCLGMTASGCVYDWTDLNNVVKSSGTPNYIAKFNSGGLIDNSQIYETGGRLYMGDIPGIISGGATIGYVTIEANGSTNSANPFLTLSENGGQECRLWITGANKLGSNCSWTAGLGGAYSPNQIIKADSAGTDLTGSILYNIGNNLGVGITNPTASLHVSGSTIVTNNLSLGGQITISGGFPGAGKILTSDAVGLATWTTGFSGTTTASGITGGTQNYVPKFGTGGNGLILSQIFDSGTGVGIGTTSPGSKFEIWDALIPVFHMRGTNNIGLGRMSTRYQTSGTANVGIGNNSLRSLTTGYSNTAVGDSAGYNVTTGYFNSSLGAQALYSNNIGTWNVALGMQALWTNLSGNYNIGIGGQALYLNSANSNSIAIGYQALRASTADNNVAIGHSAGSGITTGSNNILIGANIAPQIGNTASNQLNIGNWIYGNNGAISIGRSTMSSGGYRLDVANGFVNSASGYCINGTCIPNWSGIFDAINGSGNYLPKWNQSGTGLIASRISDNGTDIAISSGALQQVLITPANQAEYQQVIISTGGVLKKGLTTREKLRIFAVSDYGVNNDSVSIQQLCFDTSTNSACRNSAADNPLSNVPNFNDIDEKSYTGGIGEYFPATATRPPMFVSYYTGTYMIVNSYTFHNTSFSTSDLGCNVFPYYSLYSSSGSIPNLAKYDAAPPVIFTINNSTAISNVYSSTNLSLPTQKTTRVGSQFISNVFMTPGQALLMTIGVQSCASRADRAMALVVNNQKKMTLSITEL